MLDKIRFDDFWKAHYAPQVEFMEREQTFSIIGSNKTKSMVEKIAHIVFVVCAMLSILAVCSITLYMIVSGTPALFKVGLKEILFSTTHDNDVFQIYQRVS